MSVNKIAVDVISEIAAYTGIKIDIIKLVLDAHDLVILDTILESQLTNDDTDYSIIGSLVIDSTNYPVIEIKAGLELSAKIVDVVKHGRDFLSESIIGRFNQDILARYTEGSSNSVIDHTPAILAGDKNE